MDRCTTVLDVVNFKSLPRSTQSGLRPQPNCCFENRREQMEKIGIGIAIAIAVEFVGPQKPMAIAIPIPMPIPARLSVLRKRC